MAGICNGFVGLGQVDGGRLSCVYEKENVPEQKTDKFKELRREGGEENIHLIIRRLSRLMCRHGLAW